MIEQTISMERMEEAVNIFGSFDENIRIIERELGVTVVSRDGELKVSGEAENVMYGVKAIEGLMSLSAKGETINEQNVRYIISLIRSGNEDRIGDLARDVLCVTAKGKPIKAKTIGQKKYVEAIKKNLVTLGIGPAGTGKTYLEVAPLAYMRGRTLDDSFIILDEAQNTSREQMKMFLTRMGFGSKIVITGDVTQIDLPSDKVSGLKEAMRVLGGVEDIAICRLGQADVVRHVIVQRIIKAYEEDENRRNAKREKR